ncbi:MAG: class I SAM-dependent methyltransferase [Planctomycetaceae bacterium]|nr:class I SAM-dependent methyltransferase [Planctomycetaceae bacterium]
MLSLSSESLSFANGSFRDRDARVFHHEQHVLRALSARSLANWECVSSKRFWKEAIQNESIVATHRVPEFDSLVASSGFVAALEHRRLRLLTWPWEWCFSMLKDAALLQLQLMKGALAEDCILKDATPLNFQFQGSRVLLMDTASIERLMPGEAWDGYRQFCQQFLFPLMLQAWKNVAFQPWLRGSAEGVPVADFARMLSWRDLLRPGAFTHVWLHAILQRQSKHQPVRTSLESSGFERAMIQKNVDGLIGIVQKLRWSPAGSTWADYNVASSHVAHDSVVKERFVRDVCMSLNPSTVWDMGCNQGRYSRIAADCGAQVVAMDADHLTIDQLYCRLRDERNSKITPIVYNLADPSPSIGWNGNERPTLEARSKPDLVLCLALIHHLVIGSNLLLSDVMRWLRKLNATVVFEWVDRSDPLVAQLLQNRRDVFEDYSSQHFLQCAESQFRVVRSERLSETRELFLLQPR